MSRNDSPYIPSSPARRTPSPLPADPAPNAAAVPTPLQGPDLLLESSVFWEKYKLPVVAAGLLLVLALVGSEVYQIQREKNLAAASAQLDAAKTPADYQKIIDDYAGSPSAANAAMLKGRAQMDAKDFAGAATTWQTFADANPQQPLAVNALMGLGGALEAQDKFDEARAAYQKVATGYAGSYAAPLARLDEANVLKIQRKPEEARRVYENVIASFPKSIAAQIAQSELPTLNALPPAMVAATPAPVAAASPVPAPVPTAASPVIIPVVPSPSVAAPTGTPAAGVPK